MAVCSRCGIVVKDAFRLLRLGKSKKRKAVCSKCCGGDAPPDTDDAILDVSLLPRLPPLEEQLVRALTAFEDDSARLAFGATWVELQREITLQKEHDKQREQAITDRVRLHVALRRVEVEEGQEEESGKRRKRVTPSDEDLLRRQMQQAGEEATRRMQILSEHEKAAVARRNAAEAAAAACVSVVRTEEDTRLRNTLGDAAYTRRKYTDFVKCLPVAGDFTQMFAACLGGLGIHEGLRWLRAIQSCDPPHRGRSLIAQRHSYWCIVTLLGVLREVHGAPGGIAECLHALDLERAMYSIDDFRVQLARLIRPGVSKKSGTLSVPVQARLWIDAVRADGRRYGKLGPLLARLSLVDLLAPNACVTREAQLLKLLKSLYQRSPMDWSQTEAVIVDKSYTPFEGFVVRHTADTVMAGGGWPVSVLEVTHKAQRVIFPVTRMSHNQSGDVRTDGLRNGLGTTPIYQCGVLETIDKANLFSMHTLLLNTL